MVGGIIGGSWNIDIEAEGFEKKAGTVEVAESQVAPLLPSAALVAPVPVWNSP